MYSVSAASLLAPLLCLSHPQVPQILNPVVLVIEELPKLYRDPKLAAYINATYGSCEGAQKAILTDFCRHAFDGSGADVSAWAGMWGRAWAWVCLQSLR